MRLLPSASPSACALCPCASPTTQFLHMGCLFMQGGAAGRGRVTPERGLLVLLDYRWPRRPAMTTSVLCGNMHIMEAPRVAWSAG